MHSANQLGQVLFKLIMSIPNDARVFGILCNGPSVICPDCIIVDAPWPHRNTVNAQAVNSSGVNSVSWTAPVVPTGELPITGHSIQYHISGSGVSGYQYMSATQSPAEVTGLLPGTEYQVYVASVNAVGSRGYCSIGTPLYVTTYNGKPDIYLAFKLYVVVNVRTSVH